MVLVLALFGAVAYAEPPTDLKKELQDARSEIAELRAKYDALLKRVELGEQQAVQDGAREELIRLVAGLKGSEPALAMKSRFAGLTFMPYGYIKTDMGYNLSKTSDPNQPAFVLPEGIGPFGEGDDELGLTAMQTRLGFNIYGPEAAGATTQGTVEVDFYGTLAPENKAKIMMRRAFVLLDWGSVWLKAGQDWEVFSPSFPNTLNYPYLALAGNPGYRRPLVAVGSTTDLGDLQVETAVAAVRTMGELGVFGSGLTKDTGSDSGFPALQGRLGVSFPFAESRCKVGVSGVWGEEEVDSALTTHEDHYPTWAVCLDAAIPVCQYLELKGEVWVGENVDEWVGGIAQGVDAGRMDGIQAMGAWGQATIKVSDATQINLGAGIDDPKNSDLTVNAVNTIPRTQNVVYYGNVLHKLSKQLVVGFEVSYFDTSYLVHGDADNLRFQASVIYNF